MIRPVVSGDEFLGTGVLSLTKGCTAVLSLSIQKIEVKRNYLYLSSRLQLRCFPVTPCGSRNRIGPLYPRHPCHTSRLRAPPPPCVGPGDRIGLLYPRHVVQGDQRLSIFCFLSVLFPIITRLNKYEDCISVCSRPKYGLWCRQCVKPLLTHSLVTTNIYLVPAIDELRAGVPVDVHD